jgi:hypothetical protein
MTADNAVQSSDDITPAPPPETSQFDFWLGEWNVAWEGGSGTNTIRSTFGGFVVEEQFRGENPLLQGMSMSVYNPQLGKWQQTWVDDQGSYIALTGEFTNSRMILATERTMNEQRVLLRMVFYNIAANQLDWNWERSNDGGHTWQLLWHIHYTRKQAA